jgi:hypothetical protein
MTQEERLRRWAESWGKKCYHEWEELPMRLLLAPVRKKDIEIDWGRRCVKCGLEELDKA